MFVDYSNKCFLEVLSHIVKTDNFNQWNGRRHGKGASGVTHP
jgi:hypothetical protein